ncbi:hypothetical protein QAD02_023171 [Eretmocerus hayati]|uniref:Uncharacterized protein n=1 Tax=Eretmocerus hayati TaxID=131215 RepID=A0ACC2PVF2_9HYME|nr:hypothetical protein QAD02_023171 [Eretmocerus hayati]
MGVGIMEISIGLGALFIAFYYYATAKFNFWNSRGVSGPKPSAFMGNFYHVMVGNISVGDYLTEEYKKFKDEPFIGIFARRTPILVVKDPEYIKDVLIKDFTAFADRGMKVHEKVEPLSQHLFSLEPARWRPLRTKLSPTFTSGKLKEMFHLITDCAKHFEKFLEDHVKKNPVIECRELTAKFTTDVIGECAFGLEMNALTEGDSDFRRIGRKVFEVGTFKLLKMRIREAAPWLYNLLYPIMYDREINDFFIDSMKQTMKYRQDYKVKRNDFVDLLLEIRNHPTKLGDIEMTDILITAQAFVFFIAGFETSSTTMSNALYELALNQNVQDELRREIREELQKEKGDLKYETIKNMKYLHKVFCETLRKYPPVTVLMRQAMEPYTFSGTKWSIPKDMKVWIPIYAIQRDPQIYPDPDTFDPERFSDENMKTRHPSFYLPFGDGPRNCIGARFANFQSKVGLIGILKNYKVDVCEKTCIPYVNNPRAFLLQPMGGIKLKFTRIE